jgi:hypothetical protein
MEDIIDKLKQIDGYKCTLDNWSLQEIKKLLDLYLIICKKESYIFDLIYSYQGVDSFEDIFREYDEIYLEEKTEGVKLAINEIENIIQNKGKEDYEYEEECDCESEEECNCEI